MLLRFDNIQNVKMSYYQCDSCGYDFNDGFCDERDSDNYKNRKIYNCQVPDVFDCAKCVADDEEWYREQDRLDAKAACPKPTDGCPETKKGKQQ